MARVQRPHRLSASAVLLIALDDGRIARQADRVFRPSNPDGTKDGRRTMKDCQSGVRPSSFVLRLFCNIAWAEYSHEERAMRGAVWRRIPMLLVVLICAGCGAATAPPVATPSPTI